MAQIVFTAAERDRLKTTLDSVKSNAQAQAAVASVVQMADKILPILRAGGGAYRAQAAKDIAEYEKRVRDYAPQLAGSPTMPVGATWTTIRSHVQALYYLVRTIEQGCPPDEDLGDGFGPALKSSLDDLPANISHAAGVAVETTKKVVGTVAKTAAKTVKAVTTGAADIVGSTAWALLKPLVPVLVIVGVGVGIFFYVEKKGLPLPKVGG